MVRYLETFFRHRFLLTVPIFIAVVGALAIVWIQPRVYSSSVKIWVDRSTYGLTVANNSFTTPAQDETEVITELLRTRSFCIAVGAEGLATELKTQSSSSPDVLSKIEAKLGIGSGGSTAAVASGSEAALGDAVYAYISAHTTVEATGPQIITVTFVDHDPQVAAATAQAVFNQFVVQLLSTKRAQAQASIDFYTQQVQLSQTDLNAADQKVFDYIAAHPTSAQTQAVDPTLLALRQTDDLLRKHFTDLTAKLDQAKLDDAGLAQAGPNGFSTLDQARVPTRPDSRTTLLIEGVAGGLAVGLVIAIGSLLALTFADTSLARPDEVEKLLGLRVVGSAGLLDKSRKVG